MNKKFIVGLTLISFLSPCVTSSNVHAGPIKWIVKITKTYSRSKRTHRSPTRSSSGKVTQSSKISASASMTGTGITSLMLYSSLSQLKSAPVEFEIREEKNKGYPTYSTKICETPAGRIVVPKYFTVCPDGSPVKNGPTIDLD